MKGPIMKHALAARFALATALALSAGITIQCSRHHDTGTPETSGSMPDGSNFAAISPDTGKPMFVTPADAPGVYSWSSGTNYCTALDANGHRDWRMPTKGELNALFQNRAAIGGFNETGLYPGAYYWSSSPYYSYGAWTQRFDDGYQSYGNVYGDSSLRCVR